MNRSISSQVKESDFSLVNSTINATSGISNVEYGGGRTVLQTALALAKGNKCKDVKVRVLVRVELESTERRKVGVINTYVVDKISEVANEHLELIKHDYEHLKGIWF